MIVSLALSITERLVRLVCLISKNKIQNQSEQTFVLNANMWQHDYFNKT